MFSWTILKRTWENGFFLEFLQVLAMLGFLWLRNGNSCNWLVCFYIQNLENMSVAFKILNPFVPIQKAPAWLVTSYFVADQRSQWPFSTLRSLLSPISDLLFFLSGQISKQWQNFHQTPELSLPWHASGRSQRPGVTIERDIFRMLLVLI